MVRKWWPLALAPVAAVCLTAFLAGLYVEGSGGFPSNWARSVYKTVVVNLGLWEEDDYVGLHGAAAKGRYFLLNRPCAKMSPDEVDEFERAQSGYSGLRPLCLAADVSRSDVSRERIEFLAGDQLEESVLVQGLFGTYLDHCPAPSGCLAVEYSRAGVVSHAWPFLPDEIGSANVVSTSDFPYEHPLGWSFEKGVRSFFVAPGLGDDLVVVFVFADTFPVAGGLARVGPDGKPRWYRKDYSHHWPHVVDDDLILVSSLRQLRSSLSHEIGGGHRRLTVELECEDGNMLEDQVSMVNGRGEMLRQISVLDSIVQSRHAGRLVGTDPCDPLHLNFVHMLGEDAAGAAGLEPGDLAVSLRNLSAFGILDKSDGRLKRLVRGGFHRQHGVQHLERARFVMFDNDGSDGARRPSRLLMVDLETGEETTLFPTETTPTNLRLAHARIRGQLDISADRRRALVAAGNGRALEIRLADGEVLNAFHAVHDVSGLVGVPESLAEYPWIFPIYSIYYANRRTAAAIER